MLAGEVIYVPPRNPHELKYTGLTQGHATAILIDLDKYNDLVKPGIVNVKLINCGQIPHNNDKLRQLFKRCKKITSFKRIDKDLILQDGPLDDLFYLKVTDFANQEGIQRGDLPVGIGPGGEYLTPHKAANKTFQAMMIGFEIVNGQIEIGGGLKLDDMIHGNTIFSDTVQKTMVEQFNRHFNTRFTYYVTVYEPEKKTNFMGW
jgi:hypothetical protein